MADYTDRSAAGPLIPEEVQREIIQSTIQRSVALSLFRRVTMSRKRDRMPVLETLVDASFLTGDDTDVAFKPLTVASWKNKYLTAEPVGATVVIPDDVRDDSDYDMWNEITPRVVEAMGRAIDRAVFFGAGAPASWDINIYDAASTAGQIYTVGDSNVDLAEDINQTMALVEQWGYEITGHGAAPTLKAALRGLRDNNNVPIFVSSLRSDGGQDFTIYGYPTTFFMNGAFDPTKATLITGDFNQGILGIRQEITTKVLTEATLYGSGGLSDPKIALAQQDATALRFVMRLGFQVANPITPLAGAGWSPTGGGTDTFPFAVLEPSGP